jgi:hypothetical protein
LLVETEIERWMETMKMIPAAKRKRKRDMLKLFVSDL